MFGYIHSKIFGTESERFVKNQKSIIEKINSLEDQIKILSDDELKERSLNLREEIKSNKKTIDESIPFAFALVRDSARRFLGMRHFDVQLIGGLALHYGNIAEMKTGEGKTLVCTLSAYLNALSGDGVHVVTVNDYLAKRDCEWMKPVYEGLGLSVGCVIDSSKPEEKVLEYKKDIIYVNNSTLGFDYLRDNMKSSSEDMLLLDRGFNYAIVDEADSILIDEARTPLIISGPSVQNVEMYQKINSVVIKLNKDNYELDEESRSVHLTNSGIDLVERELKLRGIINGHLYAANNYNIVNHINQALRAHKLFHKNKDYMIKNGEVLLIDEFTGRIMDGRRYSEGLHQAIEAKEIVQIQRENQTLASVTYQNLFRMYRKLSGMTGTASTEAEELRDIYYVKVISVPTNKKITRNDYEDLVFLTKNDKYSALLKEVKELNEKGQPILLGTASVENSEELSKIFKKEKLEHQVLNAKYHDKEATIIANAGRKGAVTIATNMAGRGTDIMLGGNLKIKIQDAILKCKSEEEKQKTIEETTRQHEIEKEEVIKAGGLCVIGIERHESRRIDDQLRGRSGRQGDPGVTQFLLSLEDDLLRVFGGDKIKGIISKMGFKPGEAMNHSMLTKVIRYSQKRIESMNYDIRKNLLRYDDIMNEQRMFIYNMRRDYLDRIEILSLVNEVCNEFTENILNNYDLEENQNIFNNEHFCLQMKDIIGDDGLKKAKELSFNKVLLLKSDISEILFEIVNLKITKDKEKNEESSINYIIKTIILTSLDEVWKDHLIMINGLRDGIHLRSYAQKDPLNEYKLESYKMFESSLSRFRLLTINRLMRFEISS